MYKKSVMEVALELHRLQVVSEVEAELCGGDASGSSREPSESPSKRQRHRWPGCALSITNVMQCIESKLKASPAREVSTE